jgi:hypothetical protein
VRPTPELLRTVARSSGAGAAEHLTRRASVGSPQERFEAPVLLGEAIGVALAGDAADQVVSGVIAWLTDA